MPSLKKRYAAEQQRDECMSRVFLERFAQGLAKKALRKPWDWACKYRTMGAPFPGPWTGKHHPWLIEMHNCTDDRAYGQKSSQMGYSEWLLNIALCRIDLYRESVAYIMPSLVPDARDFSNHRFGGALEANDYLKGMFNDVASVHLKRAGHAALYIRGSRSKAGLRGIPTGTMLFDEFDVMDQENIALAEQRSSGAVNTFYRYVSTPTLPSIGINKLYEASTRDLFYFPCPSCSRYINLEFPRNVEFDENVSTGKGARYRCHECDATLHHAAKPEFLAKGIWVSSNVNGDGRGFLVNRMYSSAKSGTPEEFIRLYVRAMADQSAEQEFYNSGLGLPHIVAGASVTDQMLKDATHTYTQVLAHNGERIVTMGIDVGRFYHIEIDEWDLSQVPGDATLQTVNSYAKPRVIAQFKVTSTDEVAQAFNMFSVRSAVIDANPERHEAKRLADQYPGRMLLCYYGQLKGMIQRPSPQLNFIVADRTASLDQSLGRFVKGTIALPRNVDLEYKENLKAQGRVYSKLADGSQVAKWVPMRDDHYGHSRNYAELALPHALQQVHLNVSASVF